MGKYLTQIAEGLKYALTGKNSLIEEKNKRIEVLEELADYDEKTGICNSRAFNRIFPVFIEQAIREQEQVGLAFIDLDNFGIIDKSLGHLEGDKTLRVYATLLDNIKRKGEIVARYGGDEFIIGGKISGSDSMEGMLRRITSQTEEFYSKNGTGPKVEISTGYARTSFPGIDPRRFRGKDDDSLDVKIQHGNLRNSDSKNFKGSPSEILEEMINLADSEMQEYKQAKKRSNIFPLKEIKKPF